MTISHILRTLQTFSILCDPHPLLNSIHLLSVLPSTITSNSHTTSTDQVLEIESRSPCVVTFDPNSEKNVEWMKIVAKEFNLSETAFIWEHPAFITYNL